MLIVEIYQHIDRLVNEEEFDEEILVISNDTKEIWATFKHYMLSDGLNFKGMNGWLCKNFNVIENNKILKERYEKEFNREITVNNLNCSKQNFSKGFYEIICFVSTYLFKEPNRVQTLLKLLMNDLTINSLFVISPSLFVDETSKVLSAVKTKDVMETCNELRKYTKVGINKDVALGVWNYISKTIEQPLFLKGPQGLELNKAKIDMFHEGFGI